VRCFFPPSLPQKEGERKERSSRKARLAYLVLKEENLVEDEGM